MANKLLVRFSPQNAAVVRTQPQFRRRLIRGLLAMSKKYKGKTCVYCGSDGKSETKDHILAREFVLVRHRHNLPAAPGCRACNRKKSVLEKHCTTVFPFGGRHPDARENLSTMVPKRLEAAPALRRQIERNLGPVFVQTPHGSIEHVSVVHLEVNSIHEWIRYVVTGLIWHHWNVVAGGQTDIDVHLIAPQVEAQLASIFNMRAARRVPLTSIGGDTLIYEGAMAQGEPLCSAWRLAIYGGMELAGDDSRVRASVFYVIVTPKGRVAANAV